MYLPPPVMLYCRNLSFTIVAIGVGVQGIGTVHGLSSGRGRMRAITLVRIEH